MAVKLHTDDFKIPLDATFRQYLVANFKTIEQELNKFETFYVTLPDYAKTKDLTKALTEINQQITAFKKDINTAINKNNQLLVERINRITLGTDNESLEQVVTQILKDRGVIK
ncbi:hypothetical protein BSQ39_12995 [Loigolactobacillus backii]|uniref:hypothetical protein n=1 Tax=Loigolactobacillus backii TaxID=375175 RepID=UPI000C1CBC26|nr:hypothetical protein [Loigolactobacillus backii]PIO80001.1 hypothetical protein BSQ39_12995 [Loigolactobacillus backii]